MNKIIIILALFSINSFACEFDTPKVMNVYTSLDREGSFAFDLNKTLNELPILRAFNCKKLALRNRYIMLGLGPELNEMNDEVKTYSFNDDIKSSQCTIENSPLKVTPFEEKLKLFKEKKKYYNKCVQIYIDDEGRLPLKITEEQPGCKVHKISTHKAVVEGGYCFVKPNVTSSYLFKLKIKKECQTRAGLVKLGITPMDIKGILNFYAAGDESGMSTSLQALESTPLRLITSSDNNVLPSSESYGGLHPEFPVQWVNPNTFLGKVKIQDIGGQRYRINTPLLVDNKCASKCEDGLCYSPCNYAQPVVFEALLYELGKTKKSILTSWYDGGVAGPGYQGFIQGIGFEIPLRYLSEDETYKLELTFSDPKYDFDKFKNRIVRKFGRIQQHLPQLGRSGMAQIPEINDILEISDMPGVREIYGLNFSSGLNSLKSAYDLLRSYLNYKIWPPYYDKNCDVNLENCLSAGSDENKIELTFTITKTEGREVKVNVIKVERKSKLMKNYIGTKLPFLKCN
jgi:hypothetical protein